MAPSGRLRRRRRPVLAGNDAATEEGPQPSIALEQPVVSTTAAGDEESRPKEGVVNGHATVKCILDQEDTVELTAESSEDQRAVDGTPPDEQPKSVFTTPKKGETRTATRAARRADGRKGAGDSEGSPPKMRTRSAVKAERKITEFFRPAENGDLCGAVTVAMNGAVTPPSSPLPISASAATQALFRSPVRPCSADANEEKENEIAPVMGVSAKPSNAHVRVLNWEPEPADLSPAKNPIMPPPPHRIQSPLKREVPAVRSRSMTPPGAAGVVEDVLSTLSPSAAINQLKISFEPVPPVADRLPDPVKEEKIAPVRVRKPAAPKKKPQAQQQQQTQPSHGTQPTLTSFFAPVRRSSRKTKAALAKENECQIAEAVRNGKEDGLLVKVFPDKGRGIVAARPFAKGEYVVEYHGELVDMKEAELREAQYARDQTAGCYMYYFEHQNRQLCVDATKESGRVGRLINHSRTQANLATKTIMIDGAPRLVLFAARDIPESEELLYDYGDRRKESLANHPWLAF